MRSGGITVILRSVGVGAYDAAICYWGYDKSNNITYEIRTSPSSGSATYYDFFRHVYNSPYWSVTLLRPAYIYSPTLAMNGEYSTNYTFQWQFAYEEDILFVF